MFPWVYGFTWSAGNLIFLGIFFTIVTVIGLTFGLSFLRSWRALRRDELAHIRWESEFHELPMPARTCRHVFAGDVRTRTCTHGFDCGTCSAHPRIEELRRSGRIVRHGSAGGEGFSVPADRLYHRGHTWVRQEPDGTVLVGLDDLATRLVADRSALHLPPIRSRVGRNSPLGTVRKGAAEVRIMAPLDGEIVEIGGTTVDWLVRLRPRSLAANAFAHLLKPAEAAAWLQSEFERLQRSLAAGSVGVTMADGGLPMQDLASAVPDQTWDRVLGDVFLEP